MTNSKLGIAIIGAGAVSELQHYPGVALDPRTELVAICDASEELLEKRKSEWNVETAYSDYQAAIDDERVDAVIVATPNFTHAPIGLMAANKGKHILCEKPLGVSANEVQEMCTAAKQNNVVNMTAFTYRFPPSMKYLRHLLSNGDLGTPRHFRSQRFLDLPETSWGWRQYKDKAGAGDLFDMTIHRIDFAMDLLGPIKRVCGSIAQFAKRDKLATGESCPPSEVDDWSALIGEFESGAVGVWEGTTLAKGYHLDGYNHEWAEVNGSEGSAVYRLHKPNSIWIGRPGGDLEETPVPEEFLKPEGSPRSTNNPDPAIVFRYDMVWEFVSAITEGRPAVPSFEHGLQAQIVADSVLESHETGKWIDVSLS